MIRIVVLNSRDCWVWLTSHVAAVGPEVRVVLAVYGPPQLTPLEEGARGRYCSFVRSALERYAAGVNAVGAGLTGRRGGRKRPGLTSARTSGTRDPVPPSAADLQGTRR